MKKDLMFGVKSLIVALLLATSLVLFGMVFTSGGFGILMLSTLLLGASTGFVRILWDSAEKVS